MSGIEFRSRKPALIAALAATLALGACGKAPPPQAPAPEVGIVTVKTAPVAVTTDLPGRTSAVRVAEVRARVDGIIVKRDFVEGSDVRAGQRLYQIDPAPYRAALNSAKAIGLEAKIGSIEPGKQADLTAVRLSDLETQPLFNVASQLVYATGRHQVSDVWIAGRRKLADRVLIDMDTDAILARTRAWRERIVAG